MKGKALALLLMLGLAALAAPSVRAETVEDDDEYADELDEAAFLVVRRKLSVERPQVGKEITVLIEIHNAGDGPATSVKVEDHSWNEDAFRFDGQLEASFDSIPAGATQSFSYTVTPKFAFEVYEQPPLKVTYVAEKDSKPVTTHSSPLAFRTFSSTDILKIKALELGSTFTLGMLNTESEWIRFFLITGGGFVVYLALGAYRSMLEARANSRRKKALRELGMEDSKTK